MDEQLKSFIVNCKNGYYGSFEDNYETAAKDLWALIASYSREARIETIKKLNQIYESAGFATLTDEECMHRLAKQNLSEEKDG